MRKEPSMANGKSCINIEEASLKEFNNAAKACVKSFDFLDRSREQLPTLSGGFISPTAGLNNNNRSETIELAKQINNLGGNDPDFPGDIAHDIIAAIMRAIKIGSQVALQYVRAAGLEQLQLANARKLLTKEQQVEFSTKVKTAAAINIFVTAYYVAWKLEQKSKNELAANGNQLEIPVIDLMNGVQATNSVLFHYSRLLADQAKNRTEQDILANTIAYFRKVTERISDMAASLDFTEPFTSVRYKLEAENFIISGFETDFNGSVSSIEFKSLSYDEIIGNKIAKHQSRRLIERIVCFKPNEGRNVMFDLQLISSFRMGFGTTGTGKTQLIIANITAFRERCEILGLPYIILPMPNLVSELQGKSGTLTGEYYDKLFNQRYLVYAFADDAESKFIDRTSENACEGSIKVVETSLTRLEGAMASWDGGRIFDIFTNNPDIMDPAMLSRIVCKFAIDGAQSVTDYLDFSHLSERHIREIDQSFINLTDPEGFTYMAAQARLKSLSEAYQDYREPKESAIKEIMQTVSRDFSPDSEMFFAQLQYAVQRRFPLFNLRDSRNIMNAVNERLGDFDFPDDWKEKPEVFYKQDYDRQKEMVMELMRGSMKGLSYSQIRYQETMRYLDSFVGISERVERREIEEMAKRMRRQQAAIELVSSEQKP